jgi:flagellar protein FlaG
MGSYFIGNLEAVQGRYGNVVNAPQAAEKEIAYYPETGRPPKTKKPLAAVEKDAGPARDAVDKEKPGGLLEEQKAKYEEIANDENKMNAITETLNKFMAQWNADLQFSVHKDTSFLMVKFIDLKHNKVLKEFPPEDYLDMIANIRKYIGAMVDKKA